jgi:hypothetical protein
MAGDAELDVEMSGDMSDPLLTGNLKIAAFEFGGFLIGDVKSAKARFTCRCTRRLTAPPT